MTTEITKLYYTSSTISHLKKYPIVVETDSFLKSFDFLKKWIEFIDSYIKSIASTLSSYDYIIKAHNQLDSLFDKYILTGLIDKYLPFLLNFQISELYSNSKKYIFDTYESIKKYFTDLYLKGLNYSKTKYSKTFGYFKTKYETGLNYSKNQYETYSSKIYEKANDYKSLAKPKLESLSEPVLKPINNNVEYLISNYLPKEKKVENGSIKETITESIPDSLSNLTTTTTTTSESELKRSMNLLSESYSRGKPIVEKFTSLPSDISKHITDVYSSEKTEDVSAALAIAKTSRRLSDEAYTSLKPTVDKLTSSFSSNKLDILKSEVHSAGETILREAELIQDHFDNSVSNGTISAIPVS